MIGATGHPRRAVGQRDQLVDIANQGDVAEYHDAPPAAGVVSVSSASKATTLPPTTAATFIAGCPDDYITALDGEVHADGDPASTFV